ncbi:galactokinase [Nocardioides sp. Bht2]|uniref:galactokinase n=1 Tax=Nocardioides sp. Bht2 TaxID=3392297 RepID=UPI0039B3652A
MEAITPGEPSQIAAALRTEFVARYGHPAHQLARAPGRVNLIGEHTDYNGGLCLPMALPHATYVAFAPRDDDQVRVQSLGVGTWSGSLADLPTAEGWAGYVTGTLWALGIQRGADLLIDSRVPAGSGLSSSAALTCAVASAVRPDLVTDVGRPRLAAAAMRAEREVVGAPTGGLDQTIAMLAPADGALLLDFGRPDDAGTPGATAVPVRLGGYRLLVVDSGVRHDLAAGGYAERRDECHRAAAALGVEHLSQADPNAVAELSDPVLRRRVRHVLSENQRVRDAVAALAAGDLGIIGDLLTASHLSLRDDFEVSCPELDLLVTTALDAGAAGARMTGGGFGGAAVLLVPDEHAVGVLAALDAAWEAWGWNGLKLLDTGGGAPRAGLIDAG